MSPAKGIVLQADLRAAVRRHVGAGALSRRVAPVGQVVFFRSAFAIVPVVLIYALRGELASAVRTERPFGQLGRGALSVVGMFTNFGALARLPLVDATAISFASPLITRGARRADPEGARAHLPLVGGDGRLCRRDRDAGAAFRRRRITRRRRRDRERVGAMLALVSCVLQCRHGDPDPAADAERNDVVDRVLFFADLRARRRC